MLLCDWIIFWAEHFERPLWKDSILEDFGISPKRPRSRSKERWNTPLKRRMGIRQSDSKK